MSFSLEQSGNAAGHCAEEGCTIAPSFPDERGVLRCFFHHTGDGSFQHVENVEARQELREAWDKHEL